MPRERRQDRTRREGEHAGVPEKISGRAVVLSRRQRRLLDEAARDERRRNASGFAERFAAFDVAEAGFRVRRRNAEGDEPPLRRPFDRGRDCVCECGVVADQMVRRQHQQHAVFVPPGPGPDRAERNGRRGIATERLEQKDRIARRAASCAGVDVGHLPVIRTIGDRRQRRDAWQLHRPPRGLGEQRIAVGQRDERLRHGLARQRPETRAGAPCQYQRKERTDHLEGLCGG